jgi:hypothetical protein
MHERLAQRRSAAGFLDSRLSLSDDADELARNLRRIDSTIAAIFAGISIAHAAFAVHNHRIRSGDYDLYPSAG